MANSLYLLRTVSQLGPEAEAKRRDLNIRSTFNPVVLEGEDLEEEIRANQESHQNINLELLAALYRQAIAHLDTAKSFEYLGTLFQYKAYMVKVLLEVVIFLVGDADLRVTNAIFEATSETMTAEQALLCTKLMLTAPKYSSFTLKIMNKVVLPTRYTVEQIVNATAVKKAYMKLEFCSPKYWSFPIYLRYLNKPKIKKSIEWVAPMPPLEHSDAKIVREISERSVETHD